MVQTDLIPELIKKKETEGLKGQHMFGAGQKRIRAETLTGMDMDFLKNARHDIVSRRG